MNPILRALVALVAIGAGYYVLFFIGRGFFSGRFRAQIAAAAVVIAFVLGLNVSQIRRGLAPEPAVSPMSAVTSTVPAIAGGGRPTAGCGAASVNPALGRGNIDTASVVDGASTQTVPLNAIRLQKGELLKIRGWAADPHASAPADTVCLVLDGKIVREALVSYGGSRPDVASALRNPAFVATAYEVSVPAISIPPGPHRLQVAVLAAGASSTLPGSADVDGPAPAAR